MLRSQVTRALIVGVTISCVASCSEAPSGSNNGNTAGGGGTGATSGHPCDGAMPVEFGAIVQGDLAVTGQKDVYGFSGKKGQVVQFDIDAQYLAGTSNDPTVIDGVLTLFNANGEAIARNDNPVEYSTWDSRLYTILPADGNYCVQVAECWTAAPNPVGYCAAPRDKGKTAYEFSMFEMVESIDNGTTAEGEPNDSAEFARQLSYLPGSNGTYRATLWGMYADEADVDVYRFTMPVDVAVPPETRPVANFVFMPTGANENGSTATMGQTWIAAESAPDKTLARIDATFDSSLAPRLELDTPYLLFLTRAKGASRANDFYFVRHYATWGFPTEKEKMAGENDDPLQAEKLMLVKGGTTRFEGDIAPAGVDRDHFRAVVPAGMTTVAAQCTARSYGSGLRDLKLTLLAGDGKPLGANSSAVETANQPALVSDMLVTQFSTIILEVDAAQQDADVALSFYICGVWFG